MNQITRDGGVEEFPGQVEQLIDNPRQISVGDMLKNIGTNDTVR